VRRGIAVLSRKRDAMVVDADGVGVGREAKRGEGN